VIEQAQVGKLLACAMQPKLTAARDEQYRQLLELYRDDVEFRRAVDDTAEGLGLVVVHASEQMLVVGALEDSPFQIRMEDYSGALRSGHRQTEERLVQGLIQLAIAAYCFPTARDLESERVIRISAVEVDRFLREICALVGEHDPSGDPPVEMPELEPAYRVYQRRHATRETSDGRGHLSSTIQMTRRALDWLEMQGLVRKSSDEQGGTYQVLGRYRALVRELAGHYLLDELIGLQAEGQLGAATHTV
jgi:hypothetical protein